MAVAPRKRRSRRAWRLTSPQQSAGGGRHRDAGAGAARARARVPASPRSRSTSIAPNPRQPRQIFDEEALEELKVSIREVGFLQPIVVREIGAGTYELVMGERRWRAAQALGLELIPAIVRDTRDDAMLRDALLENIHRANLNPLEEAAAYQQLLEEFGATHEELARRIGRSRPQISNTIRLLNLPERGPDAGSPPACSPPATLGRCSRSTRPSSRRRWRPASWPRGCRSGRPRRPSRWRSPRAHRPRSRDPAAEGRTRPDSADLADRLSDHFETRVQVDIGRRKGRIVIEFATVDDLERIVAMIRPAPARDSD